MTYSIAGKTAIVTGAARGIGLAIARHFVDQGARVMLADPDEAALSAELAALAGPGGDASNARAFCGDLRKRLTLANLLSATLDAFERVDILVNAHRVILPSDPLDPEGDAVEAMLEQNVLTALRLSQLVAKRMIRQATDDATEAVSVGSIVNLSSIAARATHPRLLGYSIATAALDQTTRSLAVALAPQRIRVNAVAFGSVMSASLKDSLKDARDLRSEIRERTPLGRIARPEELVEAVQFLASAGAGFVTGQILTVDGGRTLLDPVNSPAH
jgi:7-alpha-hydroxysteroid dehydrogenase